ncbi:MAG TPA: CvpA family protein [Cellvibrionaceae bacterium]
MAISMIIFIAVTAFFAIRGFFNGFLRSLARTLSFLGAYAAAFFYGKEASELVSQYFNLEGIAAYITGGLIVFVVVMIAIRLLFMLIIRLSPGDPHRISTTSRMAGLLIGAAVGAAIALLLVYTFGIYQDARKRQEPVSSTIEPQQPATIDRIARQAVSKTAAGIMSLTTDNTSAVKMSEAFIAAPVESVDRINRVVHNPDLQALLNDERSQRLMRNGDIDSLMGVPEFNRLMNDEDMKKLLSDSGMDISQQDTAQQTARKIALGWQQIQLMQDDPRVQTIINDPTFQQQLQADNKLPLLMNPDLNTLAEIIFIEGANKMAAAEADSNIKIREYRQGDDVVVDEDGSTIYRWTDENGRVQYSDKPR